MSDPQSISVIGAGMMGHGIAQVFALAGHGVKVFDPDADALGALRDRVRTNLTKLNQNVQAVERIAALSELEEAVSGADVVFEAAPEKPELKQEIFARLEAAAPRHCLLASNTSVIPISTIADRVATRDRVLGTHWWNPPFLVPLVEVVQTEGTDPRSVSTMMDLLRHAGKTPVHIKKDVTGFVGNRLQHALWREAIALVEAGVCDAETLDDVVKLSFGRRLSVLGPLEGADLVGTELSLAVQEIVVPEIDRRAEPAPYLRELVESGKLGMKSGEGFRSWTTEAADTVRNRLFDHLKSMIEETETGGSHGTNEEG